MRIARLVRKFLSPALLVGLYFVAGKLGLMLAFFHPSATPVWAPTGIAIAAFLVKGRRLWPAILAGAFLVNITTAGTALTSLGIALGNTLEGLVGAWLINRFAHGCRAFDRPQDVVKFAALAGMVAPIVSATLGVTSLSLGGFAEWARYGTIWFTWWLGDSVGALTVAPTLILCAATPRGHWNRRQVLEGAFLLAVLFVVGQAVFGGWLPTQAKNYPLSFLCFPMLVWPAFRFAQRETAVAACLLSAISIWGTQRGFGPFVRETPNESLLLLQAFMGVTTVMAIALAAIVSESRRAHEAARRTEALELVRQLANAAAHEINNPLAIILGHIEFVERKFKDDPDGIVSLHRIAQAAERIHVIVGRMRRITGVTVMDQPPGLPPMLDLNASSDRRRAKVEVDD
jgi:integral membrane sensor domain MASE1